ncbi:MAG: type II secretion system major pseudopilin GspG, partial [Verrucomicrobiota bacterium]
RTAGFTLMEMILVLGIIALLVGAGAVGLVNVVGKGKTTKAKADLNTISIALRSYESENLVLPTTNQGIRALVEKPTSKPQPKNWKPFMKEKLLLDPWQNPYQYQRPGRRDRGGFDLFSMGEDGVSGTDDDIGSWDL